MKTMCEMGTSVLLDRIVNGSALKAIILCIFEQICETDCFFKGKCPLLQNVWVELKY
jgi:predicted aconitase with swiveling domain